MVIAVESTLCAYSAIGHKNIGPAVPIEIHNGDRGPEGGHFGHDVVELWVELWGLMYEVNATLLGALGERKTVALSDAWGERARGSRMEAPSTEMSPPRRLSQRARGTPPTRAKNMPMATRRDTATACCSLIGSEIPIMNIQKSTSLLCLKRIGRNNSPPILYQTFQPHANGKLLPLPPDRKIF